MKAELPLADMKEAANCGGLTRLASAAIPNSNLCGPPAKPRCRTATATTRQLGDENFARVQAVMSVQSARYFAAPRLALPCCKLGDLASHEMRGA